jgi:NAD(P)H-nitrite reductase large subunit
MWFVYTAPDVGLTIFWGPAIPLLPLTFAVATVFGQPMTYTPPSTLVQLKMDGIVVKGFGISAPKSEDHELIESEHEPDNERRMLVAENGSIVGAVFVGPPGIGQHLNDAIQKNTDIILIKDALRAGNWEALAAE